MRYLILGLLSILAPTVHTAGAEPVALLKAMDGLRKEFPPPQTLSEMNGKNLQDVNGKGFTMSHLAGVAHRLGVKTKVECFVLLTFLKDPDPKFRFIAAQAIENVIHAFPHGMSVNDMVKIDSEGHREMIRRFIEKIETLQEPLGGANSPVVGKTTADESEVIAAGPWSQPVTDKGGSALRGRLVLREMPRSDKLRETPLYVELQDVSEARGRSLRIFCNMGKMPDISVIVTPKPQAQDNDLRTAYKGGLHCKMRDKEGRAIKSTSYPFGGGVPKSQWVTLPSDGTIRLRATPFGLRREKALAISPYLGELWVIGDDDPKEYFLSGSFTVDPTIDALPPGMDHVWRGTLELPAVRIVNSRK